MNTERILLLSAIGILLPCWFLFSALRYKKIRLLYTIDKANNPIVYWMIFVFWLLISLGSVSMFLWQVFTLTCRT